jgi:hypothetical protein
MTRVRSRRGIAIYRQREQGPRVVPRDTPIPAPRRLPLGLQQEQPIFKSRRITVILPVHYYDALMARGKARGMPSQSASVLDYLRACIEGTPDVP